MACSTQGIGFVGSIEGSPGTYSSADPDGVIVYSQPPFYHNVTGRSSVPSIPSHRYPFLGFYMAMCAFPEELTPIYPEWLVQWRVSVEGDRSVAMFFGSYLAWVGICLFQGWWSCALVKSYSRPASRDKKFL